MNKEMIRNAMVSARAVLITAYHENEMRQLLDPHRRPVIERKINELNAAIDELDKDGEDVSEAMKEAVES